MKMKRTIPALPVRDLELSLTFYQNQVGFTIVHQEEEFAVLQYDDVHLHLWVADDESWRDRDGSKPVCTGAESFIAGTASCRIEVTGAGEWFRRFESMEILHPKSQLRDQWWGERDFGITDPDNNLITFFEKIE